MVNKNKAYSEMALNPPLTPSGEPCRVEGELFILQRKGIEYEIKCKGVKKVTGKGELVLTTARTVLINHKKSADIKAVDLPLAYIFSDKFEQPIFGANYYKGTCKPLFNMLPDDLHFKIWFMEGGCGRFLKCFRIAVE